MHRLHRKPAIHPSNQKTNPPTNRVTRTPKTLQPQLGDAVLRAAVDTAACLTSPTSEWKKHKAVFDACALHRATPDHAKIRVRRLGGGGVGHLRDAWMRGRSVDNWGGDVASIIGYIWVRRLG